MNENTQTNENNGTTENIPVVETNLGSINLATLRQEMEVNNAVKRIVNKVSKVVEEITVTELLTLITNTENAFTRWDVIAAVKRLAELGYGKFLAGRKGRESRFFYFVNTRELNKQIRENGAEIEIQSNRYNTQPVKVSRPTGVSKRYSIMLRTDFPVRFTLPRNVEQREIEKLTQYLTNIVIPEKSIA
ncbi:MAG: hypothetical protein AABY22_16405 [Nanoarchaeota archaeon]